MASSSSIPSTLISSSSSLYSCRAFFRTPKSLRPKNTNVGFLVQAQAQAQALDFSTSFFEKGGVFGRDDDPTILPGSGITALEDKEEIKCPPGLRQYETMAVLRPDMSEDERLTLTQKYEELLVAGGGMYLEVFNRGVIPLSYSIQKKNKAGETNTYLDGIYLLFNYFTKPESISALEETMITDDNVIRSMSFKVRNRKY